MGAGKMLKCLALNVEVQAMILFMKTHLLNVMNAVEKAQ